MALDKETPASKFPKEILLLLLGAIISMITTISITYINGNIEAKKEARKQLITQKKQLRAERILFVDDLCRTLAKRVNYVGNITNDKIFEPDSINLKNWIKLNTDLETHLATNVYYNSSRMRLLFNDGFFKYYTDSVDQPFDNFEDVVRFGSTKKLNKDVLTEDWLKLNKTIQRFTRAIYAEAFKF